MFYKNVDFEFSDLALSWIHEYYHDRWQQSVRHDLDLAPYSGLHQTAWRRGPVGQEIEQFLKQFDLDLDFYPITTLISNNDLEYTNNPHIDLLPRPDGQAGYVCARSRFNVFVLGTASDTMSWWPDWTYKDARLVTNTLTDVNGNDFSLPGPPGNTVQERWHNLGAPAFSTTELYQPYPSAFIRSDCVHAVNASAGPRLLVTVALNRSLQEIFD